MDYLKLILPFIVGVSTTPIVERIKGWVSARQKRKGFLMEIKNEKNELVRNIKIYENIILNNWDIDNTNGLAVLDDYGNIDIAYTTEKISIIFLENNIEDIYYSASKENKKTVKLINRHLHVMEETRKEILDAQSGVKEVGSYLNRMERIVGSFEYIYDGCILVYLINSYVNKLEVCMDVTKAKEYVHQVCEDEGLNYSLIDDINSRAKNNIEDSRRRSVKLKNKLERVQNS